MFMLTVGLDKTETLKEVIYKRDVSEARFKDSVYNAENS